MFCICAQESKRLVELSIRAAIDGKAKVKKSDPPPEGRDDGRLLDWNGEDDEEYEYYEEWNELVKGDTKTMAEDMSTQAFCNRDKWQF